MSDFGSITKKLHRDASMELLKILIEPHIVCTKGRNKKPNENLFFKELGRI